MKREWMAASPYPPVSVITHTHTLSPEAKKDRKNKEERVAEKKAKRRAEELAQKAGQPLEGGEKEEATDEEQFAEKLRLQQVQKDSDLQVAKELFGGALGDHWACTASTTCPVLSLTQPHQSLPPPWITCFP